MLTDHMEAMKWNFHSAKDQVRRAKRCLASLDSLPALKVIFRTDGVASALLVFFSGLLLNVDTKEELGFYL